VGSANHFGRLPWTILGCGQTEETMEDKMQTYLIRRINQKIAEGKNNVDIVEQLQALDSKKGIERLLAIVINPILKIV
jgi:hypothetical protein